MLYTPRKLFSFSWVCYHKHNPLKKDKEPFLKIKEIKNYILINNNGKENKPKFGLRFVLSNKKNIQNSL